MSILRRIVGNVFSMVKVLVGEASVDIAPVMLSTTSFSRWLSSRAC